MFSFCKAGTQWDETKGETVCESGGQQTEDNREEEQHAAEGTESIPAAMKQFQRKKQGGNADSQFQLELISARLCVQVLRHVQPVAWNRLITAGELLCCRGLTVGEDAGKPGVYIRYVLQALARGLCVQTCV